MIRAKAQQPTAASVPPALSRRLAILAGGGLVSFLLLFLLTGQPESAPSLRASARTSAAPREAPPPDLLKAAPKALRDYSSLTRRDLFKPLVSDQTRKIASDSRNASLLPAGIEGLKALPPAGVPAAITGWSYIGSATVDSVPFALVQNGDDFGYYRVGESLNGYPIREIRSDALVLEGAGVEPIRLPKTSGLPPSISGAQGGNGPRGASDGQANSNTPPFSASSVTGPRDAPLAEASAASPGPDGFQQSQGRFGRSQGQRRGRGFSGNGSNGQYNGQ